MSLLVCVNYSQPVTDSSGRGGNRQYKNSFLLFQLALGQSLVLHYTDNQEEEVKSFPDRKYERIPSRSTLHGHYIPAPLSSITRSDGTAA